MHGMPPLASTVQFPLHKGCKGPRDSLSPISSCVPQCLPQSFAWRTLLQTRRAKGKRGAQKRAELLHHPYILGGPQCQARGAKSKVDCESLTPTQGATQQSVDCESLTPTRGTTQHSVDCESLTPTRGATQQSVDCESLTPTPGATQQSVDCDSLTPTRGATQHNVDCESLTPIRGAT